MNYCIQSIRLTNFRCFSSQNFVLDSPLVIIEGSNGSGKTSLLEALHYGCYLKSFRTHISRDLLAFDQDHFFITLTLQEHTIAIGSTGSKKQVKVDQKVITSYQELRNYYRVVTVTEDDIALVKGSPEKRRTFIDNALILAHPRLSSLYRSYKDTLEQRNALLFHNKYTQEEHLLWTERVWQLSSAIKKERSDYLMLLQYHFMQHAAEHWPQYCIAFEYQAKERDTEDTFDTFYTNKKALFKKEQVYKRTLFGAHLDDIEITFSGKKARLYASRGQQKLIVLLLKIAQASVLLKEYKNSNIVFLLDDFMTDFDHAVAQNLMSILINLSVQLIFTAPISESYEKTFCKNNTLDYTCIQL